MRYIELMKTVLISHPISGDIDANVRSVLDICELAHREHEVMPVAPYLVALRYIDGKVHEDRELAIEANYECFRRKYIDELWIYGDHISVGVKGQIELAKQYDIKIIAKSNAVEAALKEWHLI